MRINLLLVLSVVYLGAVIALGLFAADLLKLDFVGHVLLVLAAVVSLIAVPVALMELE